MRSPRDNSGPAFPFMANDVSNVKMQAQGISKREYYAAKAMAALLMEWGADQPSPEPQALARTAFLYADAMLKEGCA